MSELTKEFFEQKLKDLATKQDLKAFATKENLNAFATKDDLLEFPTKTEFKAIQNDVTEIKETINRLDKRDQEDSAIFAHDILKINRQIRKLQRTKQDRLPVPIKK